MKVRVYRASLAVLLVMIGASLSGALAACGDDDAPPPSTCPDADGDGHGEASCDDDCDDTNAAIFAGNTEICDGYDNDCDLVIDDGDFGAAGSANVRNIGTSAVVTWSAEGSGSYAIAGGQTFVFDLDAEGTLSAARAVVPSANIKCPDGESSCMGSGYVNLAIVGVQPSPSCLARTVSWLNADECFADEECPQPVCIGFSTVDGGPFFGACEAVDGGFTTRCRSDADCTWLCASERCVPPSREDVDVTRGCNLAELATSSVGGDGAFAAGIETAGCADGRLRAGWLTPEGTLNTFGPEARSNIWLGVDVGDFGGRACTGEQRATGVPGASKPAVAALGPADQPQALAVYLGGPSAGRSCGTVESVPVEAIGLLRETALGGINTWVTGTNDGHPESLGETNGGGAPAVVSIGALGWVVGYPQATPDSATPIALHFVGRAEFPAMYAPFSFDGTPAPAHARRATNALAYDAPFVEVPATGSADYVQVAVGAVRRGVYDLGVTWLEDCAGVPIESVWFSLVRFDPRSPSTATATAPTKISTPARGGFPTIVYAGAASPFVTPGWSRIAGGTPVADDERGGFVVAWAGTGFGNPSEGVSAVRVSEADGMPIDARPFALRPSGGATEAASVTLYATPSAASGTVSFGYWDQETQIAGGRLICPAR